MLPSVSKANGGSAIAPTCLRVNNVRIPTPSGPMVMSDVNDETMTDKKDAAEDEAEEVPGYGPGMYTPQRLIPAVAFDQPGCVTCMQQVLEPMRGVFPCKTRQDLNGVRKTTDHDAAAAAAAATAAAAALVIFCALLALSLCL